MRGDPFARQKNPNRGDLGSSEFGLRGVVFSTFIVQFPTDSVHLSQ